MNYRFEISLPDSSEFHCEIAVNGEQTFQHLHDKIAEVLEFDHSQIASFYTLDRMGNRVKEIALLEMSSDDEETDTWVMDTTMIKEVINANCIELEYVFDFFNNRYLKVEYAGEYIADSADVLPVCLMCAGPLPEQNPLEGDDKWEFGEDEEYDDSFMEEFSDDLDEDEEGYGDEDYGDDDAGDGGGRYGSRYESIDDYLDRL
ncbi:MAG: hypothetical protein LBR65_04835 [Culturomica sp.]|jgi:hypothetical protein|nr:hypothetical protein [Culturomica sp.]